MQFTRYRVEDVLCKFILQVVVNLSVMSARSDELKIIQNSDTADCGFSISTWKSCNTQEIGEINFSI